LKTLSDPSEEACCLHTSITFSLPEFQVIKQDLLLIAQISSSSDESYFKAFMVNLLELFSTDRRLLDTRGSLIIRQLCINLNAERIYRTFAEIIEKEEVYYLHRHWDIKYSRWPLQDLEFASVIVQKLNLIIITSSEMADFRRRLKGLQSPVSHTTERDVTTE
jgi:vacuole morphology and inheritance protein 14